MKPDNLNPLHQKVVDTILKVRNALTRSNSIEEDKTTFGERMSDRIFSVGSKWRTIVFFAMVLIVWMAYNLLVSPNYRFDPYPFPLMTFILAGIAAIQAPIIMISQHRQNEKHSKRIAAGLKIDNEVLALHQSITLLIEQQLQQVHENQQLTLSSLNELHVKTDQRQMEGVADNNKK